MADLVSRTQTVAFSMSTVSTLCGLSRMVSVVLESVGRGFSESHPV